MDENYKTSQQKEGGHSLPEGNYSWSVPPQYGTEPSGAPGPVTEPVKGEIIQKGIPAMSQTEHQGE